jgi:hypothetical protein
MRIWPSPSSPHIAPYHQTPPQRPVLIKLNYRPVIGIRDRHRNDLGARPQTPWVRFAEKMGKTRSYYLRLISGALASRRLWEVKCTCSNGLFQIAFWGQPQTPWLRFAEKMGKHRSYYLRLISGALDLRGSKELYKTVLYVRQFLGALPQTKPPGYKVRPS